MAPDQDDDERLGERIAYAAAMKDGIIGRLERLRVQPTEPDEVARKWSTVVGSAKMATAEEPQPSTSSYFPLPETETNANVLSAELQSLFQKLMSKRHPASDLLARHFTILENGIPKRDKGSKSSVPITEFEVLPSPSQVPSQRKRKAIVMDCEMVQAHTGKGMLAFLTALDFLTGEVLINHYVQPRENVANWNTEYSGLTRQDMEEAMHSGNCLQWEDVRSRLGSYADTNTILVGHALENDLNALCIAHLNIVDSVILTSDAVFPDREADKPLPRRNYGLKILAKDLLGHPIRVGGVGHSAMEDSITTRDIVLLCLKEPERLLNWAVKAREVDDKEQRERAKVQREEKKAKLREEEQKKQAK
ncbi:hypothetical protein N7520_003963 [Penicillium odoratum]|uniref:uncharacterized protein n=1 Tax=Penicillium odoratum TaxID=1167516 RepID=UPI0025485D1C|nr:uncharacterized protein N7520_003963 [Penicillium odoratum]KAJ5769404.1 hypothetical protein N7520_003963 [Penicillium odoratum]